MEAEIFIILAFAFLISLVFLFNRLIKKLETPNIDWKDKNEIPGEIVFQRNISKDVIIFDLNSNDLYIGYYSYSNSSWVICHKKTTALTDFVWAYINY